MRAMRILYMLPKKTFSYISRYKINCIIFIRITNYDGASILSKQIQMGKFNYKSAGFEARSLSLARSHGVEARTKVNWKIAPAIRTEKIQRVNTTNSFDIIKLNRF